MKSRFVFGALLLSVALYSQGFGIELQGRLGGLKCGGCGECGTCKVACCEPAAKCCAPEPACCEKAACDVGCGKACSATPVRDLFCGLKDLFAWQIEKTKFHGPCKQFFHANCFDEKNCTGCFKAVHDY